MLNASDHHAGWYANGVSEAGVWEFDRDIEGEDDSNCRLDMFTVLPTSDDLHRTLVTSSVCSLIIHSMISSSITFSVLTKFHRSPALHT